MTDIPINVEHHAMLFAILAKPVVKRWGAEGEKVIRQAVRRYGEERGRRMGERAASDGEPRNMVSYFAYGELDFGPENASRTVQESPYMIQEVTRCAWNTIWRQEGMVDVGRLYCQEIDKALLRGFNPRLILEIKGTLSNDAKCCMFHWVSAHRVPHQQMRMQMLKDRVGRSAIRPWRYHVAHLYHTLSQVVIKQYGETGSGALQEGVKTFGERYGDDLVTLVLRTAEAEFDTPEE